MSTERAIIIVCFGEVPEDIEADWNRWYDTSHIPARLALAGFIATRRFRVEGSEYRYLTLYEVDNPGAVRTEGYLALKQWELGLPATSMEARTLHLPNFMRGVYWQLDPDIVCQMADTKILMMVAHDIPPREEDEYTAWYNKEHLPALRRDPGIVCVRRFKRAEWLDAPASQSAIPQFVTLYDLRDLATLEGEACQQAADTPYARRMFIRAQQITKLSAAKERKSIT